MDSYNDAVLHGQVDVKPIPNGIRIDYELGARWKPEDYLPTIISLERFNEEILPRIDSQRDRDWLRGLYAQFSLEEGFADGDEFSILGVDLDFLLGDTASRLRNVGSVPPTSAVCCRSTSFWSGTLISTTTWVKFSLRKLLG
jgi:hypothetical protein